MLESIADKLKAIDPSLSNIKITYDDNKYVYLHIEREGYRTLSIDYNSINKTYLVYLRPIDHKDEVYGVLLYDERDVIDLLLYSSKHQLY